nr:MAG: hypothetical protein [Bacteriophage sp.]
MIDEDMAVISIYHVTSDGGISLMVANLPYSNLQWTRKLSTCGSFSVQLVGEVPVPWPGRYLLVRSDRPEVGLVEKVEYSDDESGEAASMSGRFAECLLAYRSFGPSGASVSGSGWRGAVAAAFGSWPMPDAPEIALGDVTGGTGSSYTIRADEKTTAMDAVYAVTAAQSSYPTLALDWERGVLDLSIVDGLDRTRGQSERPVMVFSLEMATAQAASYSGDYSVSCSKVIACAKGSSEDAPAVTAEVAVPGFDPETMWQASATEDVSSLCSDEPSAAEAKDAGLLRAYDHMPAIAVDVTVLGSGYGSTWDLADTCEADVPEAGVSCSARIEEVREVVKKEGTTLEVSLGSKAISRVSRALMRLR